MTRYAWPGNVRELKNIVERAVVLSKSSMVDSDLLPREICGTANDTADAPAPPKKTLSEIERDHIIRVLQEEGNNRSNAAKALGISRSTLHDKLKKYGIR